MSLGSGKAPIKHCLQLFQAPADFNCSRKLSQLQVVSLALGTCFHLISCQFPWGQVAPVSLCSRWSHTTKYVTYHYDSWDSWHQAPDGHLRTLAPEFSQSQDRTHGSSFETGFQSSSQLLIPQITRYFLQLRLEISPRTKPANITPAYRLVSTNPDTGPIPVATSECCLRIEVFPCTSRS